MKTKQEIEQLAENRVKSIKKILAESDRETDDMLLDLLGLLC